VDNKTFLENLAHVESGLTKIQAPICLRLCERTHQLLRGRQTPITIFTVRIFSMHKST